MKNLKLNTKSTKTWFLLIVVPFAALFFVAFLQILIHFTTANSAVIAVVNIISAILGIFAVAAFICLPVSLIMLIKTAGTKK
jgi:hypothetical protein